MEAVADPLAGIRGSEVPWDGNAPTPVRSPSLCGAPPTIIFPSPFAERHNRAGRFGRRNAGKDEGQA